MPARKQILLDGIVVGPLGAAAMLTYFFVGHRALGHELLGPWTGVVREGVGGGLIGAATVALWFIVCDTVGGRPLRTPALLAAALLQHVRNPTALHISAVLILSYSVLHGTAFVLFGILAAVLLALTEREPILLLAVFVLFTCFEVAFFGLLTLVDEALVESVGWWTIFVANILATTAMLAFFLTRHADLYVRLHEHWASQE